MTTLRNLLAGLLYVLLIISMWVIASSLIYTAVVKATGSFIRDVRLESAK